VSSDSVPMSEDSCRCMGIRMRSKRGEYVSLEDLDFCNTMRKAYPEWYRAGQKEVFEKTKPFGAHREEG